MLAEGNGISRFSSRVYDPRVVGKVYSSRHGFSLLNEDLVSIDSSCSLAGWNVTIVPLGISPLAGQSLVDLLSIKLGGITDCFSPLAASKAFSDAWESVLKEKASGYSWILSSAASEVCSVFTTGFYFQALGRLWIARWHNSDWCIKNGIYKDKRWSKKISEYDCSCLGKSLVKPWTWRWIDFLSCVTFSKHQNPLYEMLNH